jgi:hypothetical protein
MQKKKKSFYKKTKKLFFKVGFIIIFFALKPIATHPECPHQFLAKSVQPSRRGESPKSGHTAFGCVYGTEILAFDSNLDK